MRLGPPGPRVSFVVTNHNYARFLPQAIDSLLDQSLPSSS